eukprot:CFRG4493T1
MFSARRSVQFAAAAVVGTAATVLGFTKSYLHNEVKDTFGNIDFELTDHDLIPRTARYKFLDKFTEKQVAGWLNEKNITKILQGKGFKKLQLDFDLSGLTVDKLRLYDLGVKVPSNSTLLTAVDNADTTNNAQIDDGEAVSLKPPAKENIIPYHLSHENYESTSRQAATLSTSSHIRPPIGLPPIIEVAMRPEYDLRTSCAMKLAQRWTEKKVNKGITSTDTKSQHTLDFMEQVVSSGMQLLLVEWVLMQNITEELDVAMRHALPGQQYPGLGIMNEMSTIVMQKFANGKDAVLNSPLYFHNALMYKSFPGCTFLNPEYEGKFRTLVSDLMPYVEDEENFGLAVVSRALFFGNVIHKPTGRRVRWETQELLIPVSEEGWKRVSKNEEYIKIVEENTTSNIFDIDFGIRKDRVIEIENDEKRRGKILASDEELVQQGDNDETECVILLSEVNTRPRSRVLKTNSETNVR